MTDSRSQMRFSANRAGLAGSGWVAGVSRMQAEGRKESASRDFGIQRGRNLGRLLFLAGSGLGGDGGAFLLVRAAGLGLFLRGFLLVGLRGFVAHNFFFRLLVYSPAAWNFLRRESYSACPGSLCKWRRGNQPAQARTDLSFLPLVKHAFDAAVGNQPLAGHEDEQSVRNPHAHERERNRGGIAQDDYSIRSTRPTTKM
jgi:hypothetical protein